jgi:hypothetical protein
MMQSLFKQHSPKYSPVIDAMEKEPLAGGSFVSAVPRPSTDDTDSSMSTLYHETRHRQRLRWYMAVVVGAVLNTLFLSWSLINLHISRQLVGSGGCSTGFNEGYYKRPEMNPYLKKTSTYCMYETYLSRLVASAKPHSAHF